MRGFDAVMRRSGLWAPKFLALPPKILLDDASAVTDAGAGACSQWNDRSGNAFNFTQSTGGNRPLIVPGGLNGLRTIRFDGTTDSMASAVSGAKDIFKNVATGWFFSVYKKTALDGAGTDRMIFNATRGTDGGTRFAVYASHIAVNNGPRLLVRRLDADSSGSLAASTAPGTAWTMLLATMDWANGVGTIYINGAQDSQNLALTTSGSTSNTSSNLAPVLGAQSPSALYADVEIAAAIVGGGASLPTAGEIDKLFGWAAHHCGLTSNLGSGHPYKFYPP